MVTYKLEHGIRRINSPVVILLPDGKRIEYYDGSAAFSDSFEKRYLVKDIRAVENKIEIGLSEVEVVNTSWIGEEQTFL